MEKIRTPEQKAKIRRLMDIVLAKDKICWTTYDELNRLEKKLESAIESQKLAYTQFLEYIESIK